MGSVFLGRDRTLERPVAIKVINPDLGTSRSVRQRFLQEARTVARLRHHNIVTVYAAGDAAGLLYHVMEYVPGESLRDRLDREGKLPPLEVAHLLHELAVALAYANEQGVIHRDVKPENVLLDAETGRALLADFGVAQALAGADHGATTAGMTMGSPRYMSPEQAAGTRRLDGRSDLYSLALVGYEMLAGEPPFMGPGVQAVLAQQIATPPPPLAERAPNAPPALVAAIERGLEKDPADRWPDAAAFAAALAPLIGATTASGEIPVADTDRPVRRLGWRARTALAVTVLALILAPLAWWASKGTSDIPAGVDPRRSVLVLPFDILDNDPSLDWLRDGSVSMLTMDMAQWSDLQVVDYERTLDLLRGASLDTATRIGLSDAQRLARAGGAWTVVIGQVTGGSDSLRVVARLYDVASGRRLEQTQQSIAAGADPRELFDMVARALLRISGAPTINPALAQTTTSSLTAYRAYLEGVRALNGWQLDLADSLLGVAVATDSTFALAHYKRALARGWSHLPDSTNVAMVEAAARHSGRLPQRERALIDSYLAMARGLAAINRGEPGLAPPYLDQARRRYADLVALDSTDAESWYGLGDSQFHSARVGDERRAELGNHWTSALRAFNRTLAIDSSFHLAYSHKLLIYQAAGTDGAPVIVVGDSVIVFTSDSAARRFGAVRIAEARIRARALAIEQGRLWVSGDPLAPAAHSALADAYVSAGDFSQAALVLRDALSRRDVGTADMAFRIAALEMASGDPNALGAVEEALRMQDPAALAAGDDIRRAAAITAAATVAAYSGARGSMERLLELRTRTDPQIAGAGIPSANMLAVWRATLALGMGADDRAVRRDIDQAISTLSRITGPVGTRLREQSASLPFVAYLQRRDSTYLRVLRRWSGKDVPPELTILAALQAGDTAHARRLAAALPAADTLVSPLGSAPPALRRFARAEIYIALGDPRRALDAYESLQPRQFASSLGTADARWPLYARSFLARGQLYEQVGERGKAAAAYQRFLTLWANADQTFAAGDLRIAREGLARVRGDRGPRPRGR